MCVVAARAISPESICASRLSGIPEQCEFANPAVPHGIAESHWPGTTSATTVSYLHRVPFGHPPRTCSEQTQ